VLGKLSIMIILEELKELVKVRKCKCGHNYGDHYHKDNGKDYVNGECMYFDCDCMMYDFAGIETIVRQAKVYDVLIDTKTYSKKKKDKVVHMSNMDSNGIPFKY